MFNHNKPKNKFNIYNLNKNCKLFIEKISLNLVFVLVFIFIDESDHSNIKILTVVSSKHFAHKSSEHAHRAQVEFPSRKVVGVRIVVCTTRYV